MMDQPEKLKISSDFIFTKIFLIGLLAFLLLSLIDFRKMEANALAACIITIIAVLLLLYYLFRRPIIYYDDKLFYIIGGTTVTIEIPLENIQSIKFSAIGFGRAGYSYKVKYLDTVNEIKSVRIFPKRFSDPISKFIRCVKEKNPRVKVRNWSIGINELFE